jgi:hypothetical protein|tara:strand:- start:1667 stop:1777 length:111 start_codon:yes stop_codon:yes gene_type:complete
MKDTLLDIAMFVIALWFGVNVLGAIAIQIWFWKLGI